MVASFSMRSYRLLSRLTDFCLLTYFYKLLPFVYLKLVSVLFFDMLSPKLKKKTRTYMSSYIAGATLAVHYQNMRQTGFLLFLLFPTFSYFSYFFALILLFPTFSSNPPTIPTFS